MQKKESRKNIVDKTLKGFIIFFALLGLLLLTLITIEHFREKNNKPPISISYSINDSKVTIIENNVSAGNTVEDLDYKVTTKTKALNIMNSLIPYIISLILGFLLTLLILKKRK